MINSCGLKVYAAGTSQDPLVIRMVYMSSIITLDGRSLRGGLNITKSHIRQKEVRGIAGMRRRTFRSMRTTCSWVYSFL